MGSTIILQLVNLFFSLTPSTRGFRLRSALLRAAGVDCAPSARLVASARIVFRNVHIGEDTFIGHEVFIGGADEARIHIGDRVDIGPRVVILGGTHEIDMAGSRSAGTGFGKPVHIGDGVWIGGSSTVVPGVTIGERAVIGAGSVVVHDIPPRCIAVGNPCKPIKCWDERAGAFRPFS